MTLPTSSSVFIPVRAAPAVTLVGTLVWVTPILAATVLSKFAIPPFGARGISIALPLLLAAAMVGYLAQQFQIAAARLVFGALVLGVLGLIQILKNDVFFVSSLLLLAMLHLPLALQLRQPPELKQVLRFFLSVCSLCAVLGILQFALRSVIDSRWLFPLDNLVPEQFLVQNFNKQAPLEYGSTVLRANGVFMMEPSYFSQLLAIAIITELVTFNRLWSLLLYVIGMLVSYSGTGFMVLALCLPVVVISQRRWGVLVTGLGCVLLLLILALAQPLGEYLHLDNFTNRMGEFSSTGSSGFARFVGGFYLFDQYLWDHPLHALFGVGAGMFKEYAPSAHYPVAEMPLFKMVLEFGLFGAALYFAFLFFCLSRSALPKTVALAVAATFLLNGLYVPFSHALALSLLVWTDGARALTTSAITQRNVTVLPAMRRWSEGV